MSGGGGMESAAQVELDKLVEALREFYARENYLLAHDVSERAMTHRLAVYIERKFDGWEIDCDYNRVGERRLRLPRGAIVSTDDDLGKSVYPDIVVHHRAIPENLLAVEVRKASNHQPLDHDRQKLRAMTDPHLWFAFRLGAFVVLGKQGLAVSEVYASGVIDPLLSVWLAEKLLSAGLKDPSA
jgi:hypothetical protein